MKHQWKDIINKPIKTSNIVTIIVLSFSLLNSSEAQNIKSLNKLPLKTGNEYLDIFIANGDSLITRPQHLGIVNGMASVGINHEFVGVIDGFWAPPYVSTDFYIEPRLFGERIKTEHYIWLPCQTTRIGKTNGIVVKSTTTLIRGIRGGVLTLNLKNTNRVKTTVPIQFIANDQFHNQVTLDYRRDWGFQQPLSTTPAKDIIDSKGISRVQGEYAISIGGELPGLWWEEPTRRFHGTVTLSPGQEITISLAFSVEKTERAIDERNSLLKNPLESVNKSMQNYVEQVKNIFSILPKFYSDNKDLEQIYNRSLSIFITNKMEVPEFVLNPYYPTGAVKGGCLANYLYEFGQVREILPLLDPPADRAQILEFLKKNCVNEHYATYPITGEPFGAWYMVNHEKITGQVYHYLQFTGDTGLLRVKVKDNKTVLDLMVDFALFGDDTTKPVSLLDYTKFGESNDHLELRKTNEGLIYDFIIPDVNGRRYWTYDKVSQMCKLAGESRPYLMQRAADLKSLLKNTLWNPEIKWFNFINGKGEKDVRWTIQMFKMFDHGADGCVLDEEEKSGLIGHLNEDEFFSRYGFHSMSKKDPAYDQVDVDNGGGGSCTTFAPLIAEFLYKDGRVQAADDIIRRILWWGNRLPYCGDSQVSNEVDYRQETPLQSDLGTGCLAQCILFGIFGVRSDFYGNISINPVKTSLANNLQIKGLKIRGKTIDVTVNAGKYEVVCDGKKISNTIGTPTRL
jgi:hypothetical protein